MANYTWKNTLDFKYKCEIIGIIFLSTVGIPTTFSCTERLKLPKRIMFTIRANLLEV